MKKVFTLFCTLMVYVLFSGVANAQSPVVFQTSPEPTSTSFAEGTHWYIMKLDNKFVTIENVDGENIKLTADNELTNTHINSGADQWCIVGDATNGYKFYNKNAGASKVFGIKNIRINENEGGYARTQMYASTTTNSTDNDGVGTLFDIKTKNNVNNVYYVSLKGTTNRYWNQRDGYVSYWIHNDAYGNDGSQVRFYNPDTYWDSYWSFNNYASWANNAPIGTTPFTYPESAVNTFKEAVTTAQNAVKAENISHATASAAAATLKTAKNTFRKSINGPTNNYICKIKNPNLGRFIHASTTWTAGSTFPLNNFDNERNVVFVIEKNENGTYKIKSGDTGMYIKEASTYTSTASKEDATDFFIYGSQECNSKVVIGTGDDFSNRSKWLHANNANLIVWEAEAPNSYWEFTQLDEAAVKALADARDAEISSALLIPSVKEALAISDTYTNTNLYKTAESWEAYKKDVLAKLPEVVSNKYYRINNARAVVNLLATDGGNKPKMYTTANGKKLVSSLWKITLSDNKLKLSNVNNPEKYVATLTNAAGGEEGKTANDFTDEANAVQFTISRQGNDWLTIKDQNGNILNGENAENCPINYWNAGLGSEGAIWQINEVNTFDVDLNTVGEKSYATAYLPFGVSAVEGADAYVGTLNADKTVLNMTQTTSVPAEKGFVLVGAADAKATLTIGTANDLNTALTGTLVNKTIADEQANYLVFGKNNANNTNVGFFKPTVETIPANKAFLDATGVAGAIAMNFGGNTTGVNTVVLGENGVNAPVFDLSGRRVVVAPVKGGVYIQNGKKFIK